jgi:hypothetical protein
MVSNRIRAPLAIAAAAIALAACSVKTNVDATGTAPAAATHLAVTVTQVWFASSADSLPEATTGWVTKTLATPVTLDLATLTPGTLESLATQVGTTSGTYAQVHFVLAESSDALTSSAQAIGLLYNAQYSFTNTSGVVSDNPLELPVPESGITIPVSLDLTGSASLGGAVATTGSTTTTVSTGTTGTTGTGVTTSGTTTTAAGTDTTTATGSTTTSTATVATSIDGARDVLSFTYGLNTGYILSPVMNAANEALAGGISGTVDLAALPSGHAPVWVSAETPDAASTHHVIVQRALVDASGTFTLYPLPAPKSGSTNYDVVITCAGAETVIITGVPVSSGPVGSAIVLSSTAIPLTAATTVYADVSLSSPVLPGGARVSFYQTATSLSTLPYDIDGTAVDLVTRRLPGDAFALSNGPLVIGAYSSGGSIGFSTVAPAQTDGAFILGSEGLYRTDTLAATATSVTGTASAPTEIFVPLPAVAAGGAIGTLTVSISVPAGTYNAGFLVASAGDRIVDGANIASLLAGGGGTVTLSLPGGSALAPSAGVPYQVAVRAWNTGNATSTYVRAAATNSVNLGDSGAATVALSFQ